MNKFLMLITFIDSLLSCQIFEFGLSPIKFSVIIIV